MRKAGILASAVLAVLVLTSCVDMFFGTIDLAKKGFERLAPQAVWKQKAEAGDPEAQYFYGKSLCCGKRPLYDNHEAMKWLCKAAWQNHRDAQYEVGHLYEHAPDYEGFLLPKDDVIADVYYRRAALNGHLEARNTAIKLEEKFSAEEKQRAQTFLKDFPRFVPCGITTVSDFYKEPPAPEVVETPEVKDINKKGVKQ